MPLNSPGQGVQVSTSLGRGARSCPVAVMPILGTPAMPAEGLARGVSWLGVPYV